jgi:hypothetical protein
MGAADGKGADDDSGGDAGADDLQRVGVQHELGAHRLAACQTKTYNTGNGPT